MLLDREYIRRILIIKFGGMGDILLSTPVLPNLRKYFPYSQIDYLTLLKNRDILMDNVYINRVLTYDSSIDKPYDLLRHIRKKKYNLVLDLFCNPRTALLTFLTGARYRVGFRFRGRSYAYNIKEKGRGGEVHNIEYNLDALRIAGIPVDYKNVNLSVNIVHNEFADSFIKETNLGNKILAGVVLTGGWEAKRYKIDDYKDVMRMLLDKYDIEFLLFWGSESERRDCIKIKESMPDKSWIIPDCTIRYLAALLQKCSFVFGNDSGPLHISEAVGVPVLGIYGPTNPLLQGPYGEKNLFIQNDSLDCLNCNLLECPIGNVCMTELPKEKILGKAEELILMNGISVPLRNRQFG